MIQAYLLGNRVVILDIQDAGKLYEKAYYGKPLGDPKPKEVKSPLELSIIEALYLAERGLIEVIDSSSASISPDLLRSTGREKIERFDLLYRVYSSLRDKGLIVRSGSKFGADFAVYYLGPGLEHAPYLVTAVDSSDMLSPTELLSFGRVSHSVRKNLVLAIYDRVKDTISYITFKWEKM